MALLLFAEDDTSNVAVTKGAVNRRGSGVFGASSAGLDSLRLRCAWSDLDHTQLSAPLMTSRAVVDTAPVGKWMPFFAKVYCDVPLALLRVEEPRPAMSVTLVPSSHHLLRGPTTLQLRGATTATATRRPGPVVCTQSVPHCVSRLPRAWGYDAR